MIKKSFPKKYKQEIASLLACFFFFNQLVFARTFADISRVLKNSISLSTNCLNL